MRYGSVCSGIEAATVAWDSLGWTPQWFSEIEPFPSAVLAHHYPTVPNFGDMTKFKEWTLDDSTTIDVLVGGTPCQSFSVAGLRKGLEDPRGNLMLTYLAIANKYRPKWLVWENVPGVLSSNGGNDFASFLRGLGELGYGFAYRVLDAQYFGVAQRRRRVFVVGCLGDWRAAAAVLFERHSLSGHPAPSRKARQNPPTFFESSLAQYRQADVGGTLKASGGVLSGGSETFIKTQWPAELAPTLNARYGEKMGLENQHIDGGAGMFTLQSVAQCLTAKGAGGQNFDPNTSNLLPIALAENTIGRQPQNGGNGDGFTVGGPMYTLNATGVHGVAQPVYELHSQDSRVTELKEVCSTVSATYGAGGGNIPVTVQPTVLMDQGGSVMNVISDGTVGTLRRETHGHEPVIMQQMAVRRLTPIECEALQGFPDNYTNIPWRKKEESPDGPRYKALGNSMAVPVMHWIGKRIADAP